MPPHTHTTISRGINGRSRAVATIHSGLYSQRVLTIANRLDVMNRLGRAMADPTRARILMSLLEKPGYPAQLARDLELTRSNVSNHLTCLRGCGILAAAPEGRQTRYEIADPHLTRALSSLMDVVLAVDDGTTCSDDNCTDLLCCVSAS
jgi:ArsR family transcriptional regulator, cadmium/lead-responsive transcriptional repressor